MRVRNNKSMIAQHMIFAAFCLMNACGYSPNVFAQTNPSPTVMTEASQLKDLDARFKRMEVFRVISVYYPEEYKHTLMKFADGVDKKKFLEETKNLCDVVRRKAMLSATSTQAYEFIQTFQRSVNATESSEAFQYFSNSMIQLIESNAANKSPQLLTPEQKQQCVKELHEIIVSGKALVNPHQDKLNKARFSTNHFFEQILAKGEEQGGLLVKCYFTGVQPLAPKQGQ